MTGQSKIVSSYVEPGKGVSPAEMENFREEVKLAEDTQRIESLKLINKNKVAELLKAKVLIREWTHPCLFNPLYGSQSSVTEYYPEFKLAIDKFFHFDAWEIQLTAFKKEKLNAAGFAYVYLTPDKDLADVLAEIEIQNVKAG